MKKNTHKEKKSSFAILKRCSKYFKPHKFRIGIACIAMCITGLSGAGIAWLVKPALDDIFIKGDKQALLWVPLAFIVLTLVKAATRLMQNYLMQSASFRVLEVMRDELYRKLINLPLGFFESSQVGILMSHIINDVGAIRSSLPTIVMMARQVVSMLSLLGVVFFQDVYLATWAFISLPLIFFPFVYFAKKMRKIGKKSQEKIADITSLLQETLSGIRVLKAFVSEEQEAQRFDKENRKLLKLSLKGRLAGDFSSGIMEFIGAIGVAIVLWVGGVQVIDNEISTGAFFSFVTALVMMYEPVKKFTDANNDLQKALAAADRVFSLLDDPHFSTEKGGEKSVSQAFTSLSFENVGFYYTEDASILSNLSFSVKAGERIAIVGPSGAGKTSLVNLIPRFYSPQHGSILLNGHPLEEYSLQSLRENISIVSQESFLFNVSVKENIAYGKSSFNFDDVVAAAKAAYAHDFIMSLPEQYETIVGERGVKLSGGQKQRITIARALFKNAPLLILDEATSALDSESEQIVQKALDNLLENRTSIVIAHRLSTIMHADSILLMQEGKVIAAGKHDELLKTQELYRKLYHMQYQDKKTDLLMSENTLYEN